MSEGEAESIGRCENYGCRKMVYSDDDFVRLPHGVMHEVCTMAGGRSE